MDYNSNAIVRIKHFHYNSFLGSSRDGMKFFAQKDLKHLQRLYNQNSSFSSPPISSFILWLLILWHKHVPFFKSHFIFFLLLLSSSIFVQFLCNLFQPLQSIYLIMYSMKCIPQNVFHETFSTKCVLWNVYYEMCIFVYCVVTQPTMAVTVSCNNKIYSITKTSFDFFFSTRAGERIQKILSLTMNRTTITIKNFHCSYDH